MEERREYPITNTQQPISKGRHCREQVKALLLVIFT
jgi:hypothetical protein